MASFVATGSLGFGSHFVQILGLRSRRRFSLGIGFPHIGFVRRLGFRRDARLLFIASVLRRRLVRRRELLWSLAACRASASAAMRASSLASTSAAALSAPDAGFARRALAALTIVGGPPGGFRLYPCVFPSLRLGGFLVLSDLVLVPRDGFRLHPSFCRSFGVSRSLVLGLRRRLDVGFGVGFRLGCGFRYRLGPEIGLDLRPDRSLGVGLDLRPFGLYLSLGLSLDPRSVGFRLGCFIGLRPISFGLRLTSGFRLISDYRMSILGAHFRFAPSDDRWLALLADNGH